MDQQGSAPSADSAQTRSALTVVLFVIFAILAVGVVLFKFPFRYDPPTGLRVLNLIPLAGSRTSTGALRYDEIIENILIFVPFAIYLSMLKPGWSFARRMLVIVATTVAIETLQYAFAIGRADITDVLGNTLGGLIGIGIYAALSRVLGRRITRVLNIAALVLTIAALLLFALILRGTLVGR